MQDNTAATSRVRLKICCISSRREATLAIQAGADALGLVGAMPSGPGVIDDADIRAIAINIPPPIATFLLTSEVDPTEVADHVRRSCVSTVQLVDDAVEADVYTLLREQMPQLRIVQVIHVRDRESITKAMKAAPNVDALLLDSGNPSASTRELGGTGRTHDWSLSAEIVSKCQRPVFLAGGLNSENIAEAISAVRPYGVDLCSGVRTNGALDPAKLELFVQRLRTA